MLNWCDLGFLRDVLKYFLIVITWHTCVSISASLKIDFSGIWERSIGRQNQIERTACRFFFFPLPFFYLYSLYKPKFAKSLWNSSTFNILVKTAEEDSMLFCANREWKKDGYCPRQHTVHKDNLGSQEMDTDRWWIKEKSEALLVSLMDSDHHISRLLAVYPSIMTTPSFKGEVRIKEWNCVVSIDCEVQYGSQHEHA